MVDSEVAQGLEQRHSRKSDRREEEVDLLDCFNGLKASGVGQVPGLAGRIVVAMVHHLAISGTYCLGAGSKSLPQCL